jgi:hypothetical protein
MTDAEMFVGAMMACLIDRCSERRARDLETRLWRVVEYCEEWGGLRRPDSQSVEAFYWQTPDGRSTRLVAVLFPPAQRYYKRRAPFSAYGAPRIRLLGPGGVVYLQGNEQAIARRLYRAGACHQRPE